MEERDWLNFFDGAKTFLGGLVLVGGGIAGVAFGLIDPMTGITLAGTGLSVWGLGGKANKIVKAINAGKVPVIHVDETVAK